MGWNECPSCGLALRSTEEMEAGLCSECSPLQIKEEKAVSDLPEVTAESTLGDLAAHLKAWRAAGMTRGSIIYALDRVFWDAEEEQK